MKELKPCPFCGNSASFDTVKTDGGWTINCDAETCMGIIWGVTESAAIDAWNTRPLEDAQAAEIERLRSALAGLVEAYDNATAPDLHHHTCAVWARLYTLYGDFDVPPCTCGADFAVYEARKALEEK